MLLFYISCSSKGAADYARSMFMFDHLLRYWIRLGLPIVDLFKWNHTIFSEESGEIALSVLYLQRSDLSWRMPRIIGFWHVNDTSLSGKGKTFLGTRNIALLVRHPPPIIHPSWLIYSLLFTLYSLLMTRKCNFQDYFRLYLFSTWKKTGQKGVSCPCRK